MILSHNKEIVEVAPYWNVNYNDADIAIDRIYVEVAPYWNVNIVLTSFYVYPNE